MKVRMGTGELRPEPGLLDSEGVPLPLAAVAIRPRPLPRGGFLRRPQPGALMPPVKPVRKPKPPVKRADTLFKVDMGTWAREHAAEVLEQYRQGASLSAIARTYGRSRYAVRMAVRLAGGVTRPIGTNQYTRTRVAP